MCLSVERMPSIRQEHAVPMDHTPAISVDTVYDRGAEP